MNRARKAALYLFAVLERSSLECSTPTTKRPNLGVRATARVCHVGLAVALLSACDGRKAAPEQEPSPSPSVAMIDVTIGTCTDIPTCERECDAGSADRCRRLAATYALGSGASRDEARATALYEHACDMKEPSACVFAGQMHEYAHGVPKDDAAAVRLYERSCELGWAAGCYNVAIMLEHGRGVPEDRAKAAALYRNACSAGAKVACDKARELTRVPAPSFLEGGVLP
jgi:TPR repeat protein